MINQQKTDVLLMMADIDNKDGQGDADAAAEYLAKTYFCNHMWKDFSTFGSGRHLYFLINVKYVSRHLVHEKFNELKRIIRADPQFQKLGCTFDEFYGLPTIWKKNETDGWQIVKRGNQLKLPFCCCEEDLNKLRNLRPLSFLALAEALEARETAATDTPPPTSATTSNILTKSPPSPKKRIRSLTLSEIRSNPDAFERMHRACALFIATYGRFASDEFELVAFYDRCHFNTEHDTKQRRLKRSKDVLEYQKRVRDITTGSGGFDKEHYLSLVRQFVKPEHREGVKCDRPVEEEALAVGLYVMERNALTRAEKRSRQFTTGNASIQAAFPVLRDLKLITCACNGNKSVAIKRILVNCGLIQPLSERWHWGGREYGICKSFGLGKNHPKHDQFEMLRQDLKWELPKDGLPEGVVSCDTLMAVMEVEEELVLVGDEDYRPYKARTTYRKQPILREVSDRNRRGPPVVR